MKTLIITLITLFFVFECSGQSKSDTSVQYGRVVQNQIKFHSPSELIAMWKPNNDTLFIIPNDKIHFIKIGERVYKIESPTLTEVKKEEFGVILKPSIQLPYPYMNIPFTIDTSIINFHTHK